MQRGFIWKNSQIEDLWDSLLRGFPIGSFLLTKNGDGKYFIIDGQQRATSIALGFFNPWIEDDKRYFWSLKRIPVLWLDIAPKEKTSTQKFVLRLTTQSHPWGYQIKDNSSILSVSDRRNALAIFRKNPLNNEKGYTLFLQKNVFPYDSYLPVPLCFLIQAARKQDWQNRLINLCKENNLHEFIQTKHLKTDYLETLSTYITSEEFGKTIIASIRNLDSIEIPNIVVNREILEEEDEQTGEDPTLFVRLNSSGTRIAGEELIYSIYKATFPNSKKLVENVGVEFIAPSLVISLASRLVWAEMNKHEYPYPIGVNEFRRRIQNKSFTQKLNEFIGDENSSPVAIIFRKVFDILQLKNDIDIPPVLVKNLISASPELLLMILQWLRFNSSMDIAKKDKMKILSVFTALCWFGRDNTRYVREIWDKLCSENAWTKRILSRPYYHNNEYIMYPLANPEELRIFLIEQVVQKNVAWEDLFTKDGDTLNERYKNILTKKFENDSERQDLINNIWSNFVDKLVVNKSMLLFAQRKYINENFGDFNQMGNLEDTNTPWDWDHIYPASWVHRKHYVNGNIRHWTWTIGNLRAISLEDNRSEKNRESPSSRLEDVKEESFIKDNDWEYWSKIKERIWDGQHKEIKIYLNAVVNRTCNIYAEWYNKLGIKDLFSFDD